MSVTARNDAVTVAILAPEQGGIFLGPREYRLLDYLSSHCGRYVPASELVDAVWGGFASEDAVRMTIRRLRQRLGTSVIEGGRGFGYRIANTRAEQLDRLCGQCGRQMVDYGDVAQCFACGCQVQKPAPLESAGEVVETRQKQGGVRGGRPWAEDEVEYVMEHIGDMTHEEIGHALERSEAAVRGLLQNMGIRKPYVRSKRS